MKVTINFNAKMVGSILLGCLAALTFFHGFGIAQSSSSGLTGKCAGVAVVNRKFQSVANNKATDTIFIFDFDMKTLHSQTNFTDTLVEPGKVKYATQPMVVETFVVTSGDIPGSYAMTTSGGDKVTAISVNSGNSFIFQFFNDNIIGMCQKI